MPAVTCTAQASILTGRLPQEHGIVGNGWLFRDTGEVRFWQQSNALIQAETIYQTARRHAKERDVPFRVAKLFWWFNQGSACRDFGDAEAPLRSRRQQGLRHHGNAGRALRTARALPGAIPVPHLLGAEAGLAVHRVDRRLRGRVVKQQRPELTLVYLPHLDYDPQRFGPSGCDMARLVRRARRRVRPVLDAAAAVGARVWVVSEYGHCDVSAAGPAQSRLREAGLLQGPAGPFGEMLDTFGSQAFAVCDHQVAHIYLDRTNDKAAGRASELIRALPGVARVYDGGERARDRPRSSSSRGPGGAVAGLTPGLPIPTGSTIAWPPISPGPSTSTASPAMTRASCSSTRSSSGRRAERSGSSRRRSWVSARFSTWSRSIRCWCAAATAFPPRDRETSRS